MVLVVSVVDVKVVVLLSVVLVRVTVDVAVVVLMEVVLESVSVAPVSRRWGGSSTIGAGERIGDTRGSKTLSPWCVPLLQGGVPEGVRR